MLRLNCETEVCEEAVGKKSFFKEIYLRGGPVILWPVAAAIKAVERLCEPFCGGLNIVDEGFRSLCLWEGKDFQYLVGEVEKNKPPIWSP